MRWSWALGAVVVAAVAAVAVVFFAWPRPSLRIEADGLPVVHVSGLAGHVVRVSLRTANGETIPVALVRGRFEPAKPIVAGTKLVAEAVVHRPGWIGWLRGGTETVKLELTAPTAGLRSRWLRVAHGAPVELRFDEPVRAVRANGRPLRLAAPTRTVTLGRLGREGTVRVSAVAQPWELLPPPVAVTWFPAGHGQRLLATPASGATLGPETPLVLRFADPVSGPMPTLAAAIPGSWSKTDSHTLEFHPRGYGYGLDSKVVLTVPAVHRTLRWQTPQGTEVRLEELLAEVQYLPLEWTATTADAPRTIAGEVAAAVDPPAGHFTWRYPNTPPELTSLWHPGVYTWIVRGAVEAFQKEHDLTVDGFAGRDVWRALIADVIAGRPRPGGYTYVFVHSTVPQSLNLWHDGRVILTSPGNTGVPAAPTKLGTFAVFEHIPVGTMSGTNPDGSHYHDPGIRWISYFNGGEAIHAFNRASFGTPQSLGCVELPLAAAASVWPYTPIGTLVTVEK